jgi:hypothetical protein
MAKLQITKTNDAIDELLKVTTNLRHRFLLQAYYRHRFLEIAGRYEEIFAPDMMVDHPVYHFKALGITETLAGREAVMGLYGVSSVVSPERSVVVRTTSTEKYGGNR